MKLFAGILVFGVISTGGLFAKNLGPAGCGLGSMVFEEQDGQFQQILASTTNGTFGSQTFGITTGTSNCKDAGKMAQLEQVEQFAAANRGQLEKEVAQGGGEVIDSMAFMMGCESSAVVRTSLSDDFEAVFSAASNTEVGKAAATSLGSDESVNSACAVHG